jgi:hypothetical protein
MHPVHTSIHWINFALFVGESTSHVTVSMHILCDVEYSCQRTCHVNLKNGLQISEMFAVQLVRFQILQQHAEDVCCVYTQLWVTNPGTWIMKQD